MKLLKPALVAIAIIFSSSSVFALSKPELDKEVMSTLEKCYTEVKGSKVIIDKSAGVLVFPEVTKGGIGVAIETGKGALVEKGTVSGYYKTNSASVGATVGMGTKSVVIALRTPEELKKFKESSGWEAGVDSGMAIPKAGVSGTLDTENIKENVVGFVFGDEGLLVDASLKGTKISKLES